MNEKEKNEKDEKNESEKLRETSVENAKNKKKIEIKFHSSIQIIRIIRII